MTAVIATAGHVDHGKSTLVRALTGSDPDRLVEEKARGLTIDLGFAFTTVSSGIDVAFVDVPGHVRFLKNMLAGVGSVDACLFVVAANEGWKPQSEEHLRILELLGLSAGVVALTKVVALDEEWRELARLDLAERVRATFLEDAPVVEVDAPAGLGLELLSRRLDEMVRLLPPPRLAGRPRLWVDRCFAVRGSGTVVTGTLAGGELVVGERLEVVPGPPPGQHPVEVRVRGLQSHLRAEEIARPGRVAVNLTGAPRQGIGRGSALVQPGQWRPTRKLDASFTVLSALGHELSRRGAYRAHFGSGQHAVSLRVLGGDSIAPGESGLVRLHLPVPLPLLPGDRFVLREVGRSETVGGGEVLDIDPVLRATRARPDRSVERVIAERGVIAVDELRRLTGEERAPDLSGRWATDRVARAAAEVRLRTAVEAAGPLGLELSRLGEIDRALLGELAGLVVSGGRARASAEDPLDQHAFLVALERAPFSPPSPSEFGVGRDELRELLRTGRVVESDGCYFAASAVESASERLSRLLAAAPAGLTASEIRQELGTSRKFALPLLSHLDSTGITRRRGDLRIAGPRLAVARPDGATAAGQ